MNKQAVIDHLAEKLFGLHNCGDYGFCSAEETPDGTVEFKTVKVSFNPFENADDALRVWKKVKRPAMLMLHEDGTTTASVCDSLLTEHEDTLHAITIAAARASGYEGEL